MTTTIELSLVVFVVSTIAILYGMYRYFDKISKYNIDLLIDYFMKYQREISSKIDQLKNKIENDIMCSNGINNKFSENIDKITERIEKIEKNNPSCCKAGIERSNAESFRFDDRIRRLEQTYTKEKTINGERILSVVVPSLEDVPCAGEPLGNTDRFKTKPEVENDSDENFYIKSDVEKKLSEKYPDFDEVMTKENILLLNKNNPEKAKWLRKIIDLCKKGEETYLAIKKDKKDKE